MKFCTYVHARRGGLPFGLSALLETILGSRYTVLRDEEQLRVGTGLLASLFEQAHNLRHRKLDDVEALLKIEPRIGVGVAIAVPPDFRQRATWRP